MFKNIIIGVLTFIVFSLLVQNPANLDMIVKDVVTAKDMVVDGAEYVHKTIDKEFSIHNEEEFIKEHGEDNTVEKMENKFLTNVTVAGIFDQPTFKSEMVTQSLLWE